MTKLVVHCDWCQAKMRWVTGVNCFAERYSRYECPSCGNAQDVTMAHLMWFKECRKEEKSDDN